MLSKICTKEGSTQKMQNKMIPLQIKSGTEIHSQFRSRKFRRRYCPGSVYFIVLIQDGSSENNAQKWSDLGYLICSRHLFRPRAGKILIFSLTKCLFSFTTCAMCLELPFNIPEFFRQKHIWLGKFHIWSFQSCIFDFSI